MLTAERRSLIIEKLQAEKKVVVGSLSKEFGVSEETIRRDLERLTQDGIAIKSYGGATFNENSSIDLPFNVRKKNNVAGKQRIAELVAAEIEDGDHIILDASSTAVYVAKAIKNKKRLTVITNSLEVMIELSDIPDITVISTGGNLKEGYLALFGPRVSESLASFHVEKAIFSCKGFDIEHGVTDSDDQFSQVKQVMMRAADKTILAVDSTKFDKVAFSRVCTLPELTTVVTDIKPDDRWLEAFDKNGTKFIFE